MMRGIGHMGRKRNSFFFWNDQNHGRQAERTSSMVVSVTKENE
jgi:hypothetical protein